MIDYELIVQCSNHSGQACQALASQADKIVGDLTGLIWLFAALQVVTLFFVMGLWFRGRE